MSNYTITLKKLEFEPYFIVYITENYLLMKLLCTFLYPHITLFIRCCWRRWFDELWFFSVSSPFYTTLILKNCISNRKLLLVKENKKVTGKIIYLNIAMIDMYWTMVPCRLLLILWCFLLIYKWSRMSLVFCSDSSELKHQMDKFLQILLNNLPF